MGAEVPESIVGFGQPVGRVTGTIRTVTGSTIIYSVVVQWVDGKPTSPVIEHINGFRTDDYQHWKKVVLDHLRL